MTSYCVFNVGERRVGIPLAHVREIIEHGAIEPTPIPLTPTFVQGLFNLRGQVLPLVDLTPFVGGTVPAAVTAMAGSNPPAASTARAVIVERGKFRFATTGRRIDTIEADPAKFSPVADAALHPALEAEANTDYGRFQVIELDRLEACFVQSLKQTGGAAATAPIVVRTQDQPASSAPEPAAPNALVASPAPPAPISNH